MVLYVLVFEELKKVSEGTGVEMFRVSKKRKNFHKTTIVNAFNFRFGAGTCSLSARVLNNFS